MLEDITHELSGAGSRLLDDAYMAWFTAESECEQALRAWFDGPPAARCNSYSVYRGALAREEAAARDLQQHAELVAPRRHALASREQAGLG